MKTQLSIIEAYSSQYNTKITPASSTNCIPGTKNITGTDYCCPTDSNYDVYLLNGIQQCIPKKFPSNAAIPSGSWTKSCSHVSIDKNMLYAKCKGGPHQSTFIDSKLCKPGSIANQHSKLVCSPKVYLKNCIDSKVEGHTITATCKGSKGYTKSSIDVRKCKKETIMNKNGVLKCIPKYSKIPKPLLEKSSMRPTVPMKTSMVPMKTSMVPMTSMGPMVQGSPMVPMNTSMGPMVQGGPMVPMNASMGPIVPMNASMGPMVPMNASMGPIVPMNASMGFMVPMNASMGPIVQGDPIVQMTSMVPMNTMMPNPSNINSMMPSSFPNASNINSMMPSKIPNASMMPSRIPNASMMPSSSDNSRV
jgi:hypothetical protein